MKAEMKSAKGTAPKAAARAAAKNTPKTTKVKAREGVPVAKDPAMQRWLNKWAGIMTPEGEKRLAKMARAKK